MPHLRATVSGLSMEEVDSILREARVGVVTGSETTNAANASGTPAETPALQRVEVSVDATDADDARRKLSEALPEGADVEILD